MAIKILHVVGKMDRGGVESWLMHILRNLDRNKFHFDFLVSTTQKCAFDDEIIKLGSKIIPCPGHKRPWRYAKNFAKTIKKRGPYDIIHSHVHYYSGYLFYLAQKQIPIKIAHSHTDTSSRENQIRYVRRLYINLMKKWIDQHADYGLACSKKAAQNLYGQNWQQKLNRHLLYYGISTLPFRTKINKINFRRTWNIPQDATVIGHVGRFSYPKNHKFIIEVFKEFTKRNSQAYLVLIGDGPLRTEIESKVQQLEIADRVVFTGLRCDVQQFLAGLIDIVLFPSFYEGLPLALLEAQTAERLCLISDTISQEVDIVPQLIHRLSLAQTAAVWANHLLQIQQKKPPSYNGIDIIEKSEFNIYNSLTKLEKIYLDALDRID